MARLTRMQLRAIFAKLNRVRKEFQEQYRAAAGTGPKNLGLRLPKGRRLRDPGGLRVLSQEDAVRLDGRLPALHRQVSERIELFMGGRREFGERLKKSVVGVDWLTRRFALGAYDPRTGIMYLMTGPKSYLGRKQGAYSRFPMTRAVGRSAQRRATVGTSAAYYHEYGHSVEMGNGFSASTRWRAIVDREWKPTAAPLRTMLTPMKQEFWADAYGAYALSRPSRMRLKRERPLTYAYMKDFFDRGPKKVERRALGDFLAPRWEFE